MGLTQSASASTSDSSLVHAFHSSSEWKTHLASLKESPKLMVIDFSASWCGPCKMIEPIVVGFAEKYTDVVFVKIDVDELNNVAKEFGVTGMPTFVFMKEGKTIDTVVGAKKDELEKKILKYRG